MGNGILVFNISGLYEKKLVKALREKHKKALKSFDTKFQDQGKSFESQEKKLFKALFKKNSRNFESDPGKKFWKCLTESFET